MGGVQSHDHSPTLRKRPVYPDLPVIAPGRRAMAIVTATRCDPDPITDERSPAGVTSAPFGPTTAPFGPTCAPFAETSAPFAATSPQAPVSSESGPLPTQASFTRCDIEGVITLSMSHRVTRTGRGSGTERGQRGLRDAWDGSAELVRVAAAGIATDGGPRTRPDRLGRLCDRLSRAITGRTIRPISQMTGLLLDNPHRVGKPLTRELAGYHSARRGAYRVIYRIDETARTVHVVRTDHRADVYHTR
jgi:mRNA-degrading endonuclease RelE of RelBE toxin-antitoxin system